MQWDESIEDITGECISYWKVFTWGIYLEEKVLHLCSASTSVHLWPHSRRTSSALLVLPGSI